MADSCDHHNNCVDDALSKAKMICSDQNLALTPLRRKVLELVWKQGHNSVKAYDILEDLKKDEPSAKPITVYRALDFLIENNLIHKIESQNSFVGCNHPTRQHNCAFLICNECGDVFECCSNDEILQSISSHVSKSNFQIQAITLEIHGVCENCSS